MRERRSLLAGHRLDVVAEHDRAQERLERPEGLEGRGLGVEPARDVREPGRAQALLGPLGRREHLARERIGAELLEHPHHADEVPRATALRGEPPPGPEHGREVGEQRVVVRDPVERRGRHDRVDGLVDRERQHQVRGARTGSARRTAPAGAARSRASTSSRRARPRGLEGAVRPGARSPAPNRTPRPARSRRRRARAGRRRPSPTGTAGRRSRRRSRRPTRAAWSVRCRSPRSACSPCRRSSSRPTTSRSRRTNGRRRPPRGSCPRGVRSGRCTARPPGCGRTRRW